MTADSRKVLILGGYGTFGGRLARLLSDEPRLTLLIAGRSLAKGKSFCTSLGQAAATMTPVEFDRDGDVAQQLRGLKPDIVVDASGPFQAYGTDPYRVVEAALALDVNYLDLSDDAAFVTGVARFNGDAGQRNVFLLSGVSTFPVLTAAAVRNLTAGMTRVDAVSGGIAPSPYADVGLNVMRAITGYAGKPVKLIREGSVAAAFALIDARRYTIAPPGAVPLPTVRFTLVDVPDLQVLPQLWPGLRSVWMGAGMRLAIWHRLTSALATLVRLRLLPSLSALAPLMYRAGRTLSWGEHRGGMFVAVEGEGADGARVARSWHLIAEGDDGPFIPAMAAETIIRRCLAGTPPEAGARAAAADVELAGYEACFARRRIVTGRREEMRQGERVPLYRSLLGEAWAALPAPIRTMHDLDGELIAEGTSTVERGNGSLARLVASVFGFPRAGADVPVSVSFRLRDGREYWRRTFADRPFTTTQEEGHGRFERLLVERFGPVAFAMALVLDGGQLHLKVRGWSVLGIPMPLALAPVADAYERVDDKGRFRFHVEIALPLIGMIVRYRGWLIPRSSDAR